MKLLPWLLIANSIAIAAAADAPNQDSVCLQNGFCAIRFAPNTGELTDITNVPLTDPVLKGKPSFGTPFRVHADFPKEWFLETNPETAAQVHLGPEGLTLKTAERTVTTPGESLQMTYAGGGFECLLEVVLAAKSGESTWTLSVKNTGDAPRNVLVEFPRFQGVQLGPIDARNLQTVLNQAGWIGEAWKEGGGIYGNSGQWSMQWHALFDPASQSALGLIVMDPDVRNKRLVLTKPNISVQSFPPHELAPGATVTLPPVSLLVYQGDWKRTARRYAAWYAKAFQHATPPQWFVDSDTIDGRHLKKKKGPGDLSDYSGQFALDSFRDLPACVLQAPVDNTEYAFWSRGSMLTGKHTDGDNVVREDLGGAEAMREGFNSVRKLGLHSTLYIEGYIVSKESDLAQSGKAERWSVMSRDGKINGPYTGQGFFHMCPGCVEWQDHLVSVVTRALKECGADGIRLDSLGFYFLPCYNPAHQHRSPFDYNQWIAQLLSKVRAAAVAVNPNALLTTEAPVDFYGQWFHGALTQVYASTIPPMRLAVGPYRPAVYSPGGALWGSLAGLAGGREEWGGKLHRGEANWLCACVPVHKTLVWGDVADEDPKASDPEIVARRFIDDRCEAIVAARVPHHEFRWPDGVKLLDERKRYELLIPAGDAPPKQIVLCDIETLDWRTCEPVLRDGNLVVTTESNWLLVILPRGEQCMVTFDRLPEVRPGDQVTVQPAVLSGDRLPEKVEVWAPGLQIGTAGESQASVRIGESATLQVPNNALPGWYQVHIRGQNVLGFKRLLRVVADDAK